MKTASYGSWTSPITADLIATQKMRLKDVQLDGGDIYWLEMRPTDAGRHVVVKRRADGSTEDVTPAPYDVRTRVHEYGGGSFLVDSGTVYFSHFPDQRLYRKAPGTAPVALTPESKMRYADFILDAKRGRLICIAEDHGKQPEAENRLVTIPVKGGPPETLMTGHDFFSSPRLSPDGRQLAWLTWDHPNLPWDGTELWVASLDETGNPGPSQRVAGGTSESIFQPEWSADGRLHFVSDRTGYWNLYAWNGAHTSPLCECAAEFGMPQWVFGMSTYAFGPAGEILCAFAENGTWRLGLLRHGSRELARIESEYDDFDFLRAAGGQAVAIAGGPARASSIVRFDFATRKLETLRTSMELGLDPALFSIPEPITFATTGNRQAHAFFYAPHNPAFQADAREKPPLVVISHGGPTAATTTTLSLEIQFWTTRGFGVLDVNYGGSTGYGRAYRERLNGQWGVVGVDDCVNGAKALVQRGSADVRRLAIRGGSAGGYTTLAALAFRDYFKAGASYYGVSDIEVLMKDTHKFESKYDRSLVGPYPQSAALYRERSPIYSVDRLSCPLILFQGLEDKVVLPNQAEMMFDALKKKGIPVAYLPFAGEQHGFRRSENIKRSLEAELYFYGKVFGFTPADRIEPVKIENL